VEIVDSTETQAMMPIPVQRMIAAVRSAAK
jgi:hypothetical protein